MARWRAAFIYRARALVRPPVTLGVRLLVHDVAGRILLVKHTYARGWHFPGGGVDPGESARAAAEREAREEAGVGLDAPAQFFGLYFNERLARRDHVALFLARDHPVIEDTLIRPQAMEIAEARFLPLDALPDDLTGATRRRLAEVFEGAPIRELW